MCHDGYDTDTDTDVDTACPEPTSWYADDDGDGFGDDDAIVASCDPVEGHVAEPGDCDDAAADVNPMAIEVARP
ncbi:MAG: hypothetical protein Q8P41_03620 [Pseudomonadota bacterium]|nr:hypothetical protein [Pseudomonadota bacterium]